MKNISANDSTAITPDLDVTNHAATSFNDRQLPMIMTATGGRIEGAGKVAYLGNGHDMAAFTCPEMKRLWVDAVGWALE